MEPAKAVRKVRPFFVNKLLNERARAVIKLIFVFVNWMSPCLGSSVGSYGFESLKIFPSNTCTIRVEYVFASSGLCVTMMTRRSLAMSFNKSMIWTEVSESSAPVGSSAKTTFGLLTRARAIAIRCICPPDIWLGFLYKWSFNPTRSSASIARFLRSALETPESVIAISTFESAVWWPIRLYDWKTNPIVWFL